MKDALKSWGPLGLTLILGALLWWWTLPPSGDGEYHEAKPDPRVGGVGTEVIKPEGVVVLKPEAKDKLGLPAEIKKNPKKHVTGTAVVNPGEKKTSVVSVLDEGTGETTILEQKLSTPWLASEQRGQAWLGYGFKNGGVRVFRLQATEDLIQTKSLHFGVAGSLDSDGSYFVGAKVGTRW